MVTTRDALLADFRVQDASVRQERRLVATGRVVMLLGAIGHLGYTFLFLILDHRLLFVINVISTLWFLGLFQALRANAPARIVWWLAAVELVCNNSYATIELGLDTGFTLYAFIGVALLGSVPFDTARNRVLGTILGNAIGLAACTWVIVYGPTAPLDALTTMILFVGNGVFAGLCVAAVLWFFVNEIHRAEKALESEYQRSEGLLFNLMPAQVAERLKHGELTIADDCEETTVLFADIVGFTPLASKLHAVELVGFLRGVVSRFDQLAGEHGIEKIKTIGDAYMAVAGAPEPDPDHAAKMAGFAQAMIESTRSFAGPEGERISLRVGLHSGPLAAGVIGERRMAFDLWGDTVNTAARMESSGVAGRVQISDATYRYLAGRLAAEPRGEIEVKGKGKMRTWLLAETAGGPAPAGDLTGATS